jgi:predicted nuclease of predicted toxin-antitoxin system
MIILLDENFPLALYTRLQKDGFQPEHILLGLRGIRDSQIMARLKKEELRFLTQDKDFVEATPDCKASIIWSHVTQSILIEKRVEIWMRAINEFFSKKWTEKFFEVYDDGKLHPSEVIKT